MIDEPVSEMHDTGYPANSSAISNKNCKIIMRSPSSYRIFRSQSPPPGIVSPPKWKAPLLLILPAPPPLKFLLPEIDPQKFFFEKIKSQAS